MTSSPSPVHRFDSVTAYSAFDHVRLESLLAGVCAQVEAGQLAAARAIYREYDQGLARHIRIEEDLLFPLFEARTGIGTGPTSTLRQEHREIERAVGMMREALELGCAEAFRDGVRFLEATLPQHNAKEDHILYPTTDRVLSDRERLTVAERLQRGVAVGSTGAVLDFNLFRVPARPRHHRPPHRQRPHRDERPSVRGTHGRRRGLRGLGAAGDPAARVHMLPARLRRGGGPGCGESTSGSRA